MQSIHATFSASISELKQNPTELLEKAEGEPIAIFQHDLPTAYLVPAQIYEQLINRLEDYELAEIIKNRQAEKDLAVEVTLDDL